MVSLFSFDRPFRGRVKISLIRSLFIHSFIWMAECQAFSSVVRIGPSTAGDGVHPFWFRGGGGGGAHSLAGLGGHRSLNLTELM